MSDSINDAENEFEENFYKKILEKERDLKRKSMINAVFALVASMIAGVLVSVISNVGVLEKNGEKDKVSSLFKASVIEAIKLEPPPDIKTVKLLYEGASEKIVEKKELVQKVRKSLVELHYEITANTTDKVTNDKNKEKELLLLRGLIDSLDDISPYADLQQSEQVIFEDIAAINQNDQIENKIQQLAELFKVRFNELETAKSEARWSLIFGIAGVVGAVVSIGLTILQSFQRNQFKEIEFEKIISSNK